MLITYGCGGGGEDNPQPEQSPTYYSGPVQKTLIESTSDLDSTPEEGTMSDNPLLRDQDTTSNALSTVAGLTYPWVSLNIGIKVNNEPIDRLYLYTSKDNIHFLDPSDLPVTGDIKYPSNTPFADWGIYTSTDGINWSFLSDPISINYNHTTDYFELRFPVQTTDYLKVVVSYLGSDKAIYFTEIKAYKHELIDIIY